LAPIAALLAGVLPLLNDQVIFPTLAPLAPQDQSLVQWLQALDSLIVCIFSLAIVPLALELHHLSSPGRLADYARWLGVGTGSSRGLIYLLLAATAKGLPSTLRGIDFLLVLGVGLWLVVVGVALRQRKFFSSTLTGLGIVVGAAVVVAQFGVVISPVLNSVGYLVWFVWLGVSLRRIPATTIRSDASATSITT